MGIDAVAARQPPHTCGGVGVIRPRWAERRIEHFGSHALQQNIPQQDIQPHSIHLWAVDLASLQSPAHRALLTEPELARAARYRNHAQQAMYLGGRVGLRLLLGACTGLGNGDLRFVYGGRGKPMLANRLPGGELCFNYTLSAGRALYALAWNRQVGIDMETLPRKIASARLAKRNLSAAEQRAWRAVPEAGRDYAMLACWTRKESYGKALGVGIRYTLHQAPVCTHIDSPVWQCGVTGMFDSPPDMPPDTKKAKRDERILHGLQLALPFPGIAALVYDGEALVSPAAGLSLRGWQWPAHVGSWS